MAGQTTTDTGTYTPHTGSLQVTIEPEGARNASAQWCVDGGVWQSSGATLTGIPVGTHVIAFRMVQNWATPSNQQVVIVRDQLTTATAQYDPFVTEWIMKKKPTKTTLMTPKKGSLEPDLNLYFSQGYQLSIWDGSERLYEPYTIVQKKAGRPVWSYEDDTTKIGYKQKNGLHIMTVTVKAALPDTIKLLLTPPAELSTSSVSILLQPMHADDSGPVRPMKAVIIVGDKPVSAGELAE